MIVETRRLWRQMSAADVLAPVHGWRGRWLEEAAVPIGIAAAYYVGCLAGFALRFPSSGISFLWPPNAILLAGLLIGAPRVWPALLAGAFVAHGFAHAEDGIPAAAWSIQYVGNATQALLAAWIVRRFGSATIHDNFRAVLVFVLGACIVAPAVASIPPSFIYVWMGWTSNLFSAWLARSVSNAIAALALVPSLLIVWRSLVRKPDVSARRVAEFVAVLLGLVATHTAVHAVRRGDLLGLSVALYATTPFLLWTVVRFGGGGLSLALLTTLLISSRTATDMSPGAFEAPAEAIIGVQLLLTATAVPLMLLAGLLKQERAEHRALVDVENQNRAILRALPDATLLHTRDGALLQSYSAPVRGADGDEPTVTEHTEGADLAARRYEARSVAVDDERTLTIVRDITARWRAEQALREARQRYALAISTGVIGVWDYDIAARRVHVEGTLKAALGYDEAELGDAASDWDVLVFDEDRQDVVSRVSAVITGAARTFEVEFRMIRKDGSLLWIVSKGAVAAMDDGRVSRVIGTYMDVTEQRESARALREANETLVRLGRISAMGAATTSIAHELNQPLSAITANVIASLRTLESQPPAALRETLDDVLLDARRASEIIERTQRLFANRPSQQVAVSMNEVVREVLKIAAPRLRELHVRVTQELDPHVPDVNADPIQMQQVVFNLVLNAAEAMHDNDGQPRLIQVSTKGTRSYAVVSVRDTGPGLGQADVTRLFDPFYTTKTGGSGMGLAISRSIVRSHGGRLWAVSNRDRGATFRLKLPAAQPTDRVPDGQGRKVLVADDHAGMRRSLVRLLAGLGHQVEVAANGAEALDIAARFEPDAAVVDMSLGDMTGVDVAKGLRSMAGDRRLLLIALSAYDDEGVRRACIAAGFDTYLVKQKHLQELQDVLARLV